MISVLAAVAALFAVVPAVLFLRNLKAYAPLPPSLGSGALRKISVLIPARNEEENIAAAVASALTNTDIELEVVVLDDDSTDRTAEIVRSIACNDPRARLEQAPPLPADWCGKQHACHVLAGHARHELLLFLDADVRLAPDALARMAQFMDASGAGLASGIPRQEMVTFSEKLLLPLMHFVLLGFLPMERMRRSTDPAYGAGCGQLFLVRADAYRQCGGHALIHNMMHDGTKLPRAFRAAGFRTDLFDATDAATCRMYRSNAAVWDGLGRSAHEALGAPRVIFPATIVLVLGQVLPFCLVAFSPRLGAIGLVAALLPRFVAARRFHQSLLGALLHPLGILGLLAIQWNGFFRAISKRPSQWKGRAIAACSVFLFLASPLRAELQTIAGFELPDQYERMHVFHFPRAKISVVTLADREGSKQLDGWVRPLYARYEKRIEITGLADVSAAPGPLHGFVRRSFLKQCSYPVMLDWQGGVTRSFAYTKDQTSIYLLDRQGRVLKRMAGAATAEMLQALFAEIDAALAK